MVCLLDGIVLILATQETQCVGMSGGDGMPFLMLVRAVDLLQMSNYNEIIR
jgi:hypothetical protein